MAPSVVICNRLAVATQFAVGDASAGKGSALADSTELQSGESINVHYVNVGYSPSLRVKLPGFRLSNAIGIDTSVPFGGRRLSVGGCVDMSSQRQ